MALNKTRIVENAQKFLSQGRINQAILEYQQILRIEPKDQVTLMTVGDLYVRMGDTPQAVEYFEKLAQLYLTEGFVSKCIAIYKKIAKLAPEETRPLERLAELYVQQGVMSEARPLYLQLMEGHLKANRPQQAVELLRKLLELEPENLRILLRLAELYHTIGREKESAHAYLNAAHRMLDRGDFAEVQKLTERALLSEPENKHAKQLKARTLAATGKVPEAIALLEGLPDFSAGTDTTQLLVDLYFQSRQSARAVELARKVFRSGTDRFPLIFDVAVALLDAGDADAALGLIGEIREAMLDDGDPERLGQALRTLSERLPGRLEPLEWLVDFYRRTSDSFRLPDALDQLGEAATAAGNLERAKEIFEELLDREPESEHTRRRVNQVRAGLGVGPLEEASAPPPVKTAPDAVPQLAAAYRSVPAAAAAEPPLDEETQRFVSQTLTDVDLFSSYGLAQKAIDLLDRVLQRVPRHAQCLERLLDLHLGAGNDQRTAELAAQLEQIFTEQGDAARAERFSELRRRFQRAASLSAEGAAADAQPATPQEFTIPAAKAEAMPMVEAEPAEVEEQPEAEPAVHEVDLSAEWAAAQPQEAGPGMSPAQFFSELTAEVEGFASSPAAAGAPPPPPVGSAEPAPTSTLAAAPSESIEQLREVFEEFRAEMGETEEEAEDLETHYNLGIAYREMGLLEEAIGEFQKVAKAVESGRPFRYAMQCYTLLGLSFLSQGQPKIATMWYEKALGTPGLDQESILALRYDLGLAQELSGETSLALESFRQVYAMNIDYRDVAERIAVLDKQR